MALRIHQDEGLSLGQLGRRLGISKARADQLVRQARKQDHRAGLVQVQQVTLSVQIPGETGIRLSEAAEAAGQSAGHLVDQALRAYLADRGAEM
jgi:DNA-binding transcriptional regulator LsrR (DeoR family)